MGGPGSGRKKGKIGKIGESISPYQYGKKSGLVKYGREANRYGKD